MFKAKTEESREQAASEKQWAEFWASPTGRARKAREEGRQIFQIALTLSEKEQTALGALTGDKNRMKENESNAAGWVEQIENEGWRLDHVGYVFQETGSVSRDKLLSSGQTAATTGKIVGIYLFRPLEKPE